MKDETLEQPKGRKARVRAVFLCWGHAGAPVPKKSGYESLLVRGYVYQRDSSLSVTIWSFHRGLVTQARLMKSIITH